MEIIPARRRTKEWWEDDSQRAAAAEVAAKLGISRRSLLKFMAATSTAAGAAMLLEACGGGKSEQTGASSTGQSPSTGTQAAAGGMPADAAAADKQVMRWPTVTDPSTMEFNGSYYGGGFPQLWAPLQVMDVNFNVVNYACESAEKSADGTTWTYKLNRNAKWTNGQPVTADDWVYSFKYTVEPKRTTNSALTLFYEIKGAEDYNKGKGSWDAIGVKALDPYSLQIELRRPFAAWPFIVGYWSATPVYRPAIEKFGDKWTEPENIVSNGPFKMVSWKHDDKLVFEPNENWIGQPPKLRRVEMPVVPAQAGLNPYENDEVDFAIPSAQDWPRVRADATLKKQIEPQAGINTWYLLGEVNHKPFDDKQVRLAMHHAIDRDKLANQVLQGLGVPAYSFVAPEIPLGFIGDEPEMQDLQRYDPQRALAMLKGTPYEGGTNWPSKIPLAFPNTTDAAVTVPMAEALAIMLRDVLKMPVEVQGVETRTFYAQIFQSPKPFPLVMPYWTADYPHPEDYYLPTFASIPPPDKRQHTFSDPELDAMIAKAGGIFDEKEAEQIYKEMGRRVIREGHATMLIHRKRYNLFKPRVAGIPRNAKGEWPQSNMYRLSFTEFYIKKI